MTEALLNDQIIGQVREVFSGLKEPVAILFFGSRENCEYCNDTRQLLEELAAIDDRLTINVHDIDADFDIAKLYRIDKTPGIVIAAMNGDQISDYGIQYSGIPSGHEFSTLIQAILLVSGRDSGLTPQTREFLKNLKNPLHLQVFVTPT
jgi:alkyl hydroperoxide reductase subunit AhpF